MAWQVVPLCLIWSVWNKCMSRVLECGPLSFSSSIDFYKSHKKFGSVRFKNLYVIGIRFSNSVILKASIFCLKTVSMPLHTGIGKFS